MPKKDRSLKLAKALRFHIERDGNLYASVSSSQGSFFISPEVLSFLCSIGNEKKEFHLKNISSELKEKYSFLQKKLPDLKEWQELLSELTNAGIVLNSAQNKKDKQPEDGFADSWIQWAMISDKARCNAYEKAIRQHTNSNSIVLDVGAGCGFLTAVAADAGAKKITSIEETQSAFFIAPILKKLGSVEKIQHKITVENRNSFDVEINKDVTLVVSELFGNDPFSEGVLPTLKEIGSRFGSKQPQYIPEKVSVYFEFAEILEHPTLHRLSAFQKQNCESKDFSQKFLTAAHGVLDLKNISFPLPIAKNNLRRISKSVEIGSTLLNPPRKNSKKDLSREEKLRVDHECQNVTVGLVWFRVHLTKDITISSHPQEEDACDHWSPIAIALNRPLWKSDLIHITSSLNEFENHLHIDIFCDEKRIGGR